jgi:hypothetical protein
MNDDSISYYFKTKMLGLQRMRDAVSERPGSVFPLDLDGARLGRF